MTTTQYIDFVTNGVITLVSETATLSSEDTLADDEYFALLFCTKYKSYLRNYNQYKGNFNYSTKYSVYDIDIFKLAFDQGYYISKNFKQIEDTDRGRVIIVTTTDATKCIELTLPLDAVVLPVVGPLTDYDGNPYTTVDIGSQRWIVENFRCTTYADGTAIPNITLRGNYEYYLPSKDELSLMWTNLKAHGVGDFLTDWYWSSSENDDDTAWANLFGVVLETESTALKSLTFNVRPFCYFYSDSDIIYSLRDVGPSGGLIFHVIDNGDGSYWYWEAAPADVAPSVWSNIDDVAVVWTDTNIGDGVWSSVNIIAQAGHTNSAALLCNHLTVDGWLTDTTGAYCLYYNNIINKDIYGCLYNWYALHNAHDFPYLKRGSTRELGWRVPTVADMMNLEIVIGVFIGSGGKLKEIGTDHWMAPNLGATDLYRFKGIGGGNRFCDIDEGNAFDNIKVFGDYWLADDAGGGEGYAWFLENNSPALWPAAWYKNCGLAVRLVKDI